MHDTAGGSGEGIQGGRRANLDQANRRAPAARLRRATAPAAREAGSSFALTPARKSLKTKGLAKTAGGAARLRRGGSGRQRQGAGRGTWPPQTNFKFL